MSETALILPFEQQLPPRAGLSLPGQVTRTAWTLPKEMPFEQWLACGQALTEIEGAVQWWLGDWWAFGEHKYGERKALFAEGGPLANMTFQAVANYGWVAKSVETSTRVEVLTWTHHREIAHLPPAQQRKWLARAEKERWSSNELKSAIARVKAIEQTTKVNFQAEALGKFPLLYADPPWQYENPPMGGSNRSIENHYPTMTLEEICAVPVRDIANDDCVLFMWATTPKLRECFEVLAAWDFNYRTNLVWVKDKIGMGYHVRGRHELLLIAKRGELPPPAPELRPDSVVEAPRDEHSEKPPCFYELIEKCYPALTRRIELFARERRPGWESWGNQV